MNNFILCGMQFGDEGKGTFCDYLAHEQDIDCVVRYNGGSQASHTVITPEGIIHKFSQLGSGMFLDKCHTYLTENMVINLDNLYVELEVFSSKTDIPLPELLDRIHIHENCYVVTPYHKLINKLREFSKGSNRRGTVGTGVSEVRYLLREPKIFPYARDLGLKVKDIFNPHSNNPVIGRYEALYNYVKNFYREHEEFIWQNVPENMHDSLVKEVNFLLSDKAYLTVAANYIDRFKYAPPSVNLKKCIYTSYELSFRKNCQTAIFEGAQGLLIDGTYGIKPNTTFLDTTNHFALEISFLKDSITKVGIAKAFTSRHGMGVFPTESVEVADKVTDENQEETFWNGKIRFGWFDAVLFRYAQSINQVDELYLSSLDKLSCFETIKVCNEYIYNGIVDENFKKIFDYIEADGCIIITDIKANDDNLIFYLQQCTPKYIEVDGWNSDISNISEKELLPGKCIEYVELLEDLTGLPVTLVSVGPTREKKIRM